MVNFLSREISSEKEISEYSNTKKFQEAKRLNLQRAESLGIQSHSTNNCN